MRIYPQGQKGSEKDNRGGVCRTKHYQPRPAEKAPDDGGNRRTVNAILYGQTGNYRVSHALRESQQRNIKPGLKVPAKLFAVILVNGFSDWEKVQLGFPHQLRGLSANATPKSSNIHCSGAPSTLNNKKTNIDRNTIAKFSLTPML